MAQYLHLFETEAEYNTARANDYEEPWVSYTEETEEVNYNKEETLIDTPLTFVITNGGNITWSLYDDDSGEYRDAEKSIEYKKKRRRMVNNAKSSIRCFW